MFPKSWVVVINFVVLALSSIFCTIIQLRNLKCVAFFYAYASQAQDNIMTLPLTNGWGEKHCLFIKWKYVEAKVSHDFFPVCTFSVLL